MILYIVFLWTIYINNSGKVYVCTLDASKAFDRVNFLI